MNKGRRKKKWPQEESGEDRISRLPDPLLTQILLHVPTKDAVRTSILSTRWRNLWISVPGLDLYSKDFSNEDDFVSFVDRFLDFQGKLFKFWLWYDVAEPDARHFKSWINTVVKRKTQHVFVHNGTDDVLVMPPRLFVSETLVSLELTHAILVDIPEIVSLPCVKSMHLEEVEYADDSALDRLISCCPTLEDLLIVRNPHDNIKVLRVRSKTLKSFGVASQSFEYNKGHGVVIDAPNLMYLNLWDQHSESFVISNLGSSVKADIDVDFNLRDGEESESIVLSKRKYIREFLVGISNVKHLSISCYTVEIIRRYSMLESLPQFRNLSYLKSGFVWYTFSTFLKSCPNLKSLVLDWRSFYGMEKIGDSFVPKCFLSSLEYVELQNPITGYVYEMVLIRYFLENSAVLKKLIIRLNRFPGMVIRAESDILKELMTFPRRSSACQVFVI